MAAKVKVHRCAVPTPGFLISKHSCANVERALEQQGIEFETVYEPALPRGRRKWVIEKTGQDRLPVIEFADGSVYREESKDMVATIDAGKLFDHAGSAKASASA